MGLFYFCNYKGINILKNLEIKLSLPMELNDPFEFYPYDENDSTDHFEIYQKAGYGLVYYLSMCSDYKNPRVWSNYADNHNGFMIEFDTDSEPFNKFKSNGKMFDIDYETNERVHVSLLNEDQNSYFCELAKRKGSDWKEEKEVRFFLASCWIQEMGLSIRDTIINNKIIFLMKISKESILSVTYGYRMPINSRVAIAYLVNKLKSKIKIFEALPDGNSFRSTRKQLKKR